MKYCTNCGVKVKDGAKFCPKCGMKFEELVVSEQAPVTETKAESVVNAQPVVEPVVEEQAIVEAKPVEAKPVEAHQKIEPVVAPISEEQVVTPKPAVEPVATSIPAVEPVVAHEPYVAPTPASESARPEAQKTISVTMPAIEVEDVKAKAKSYWNYFVASLKNPDRLPEHEQVFAYSVTTFVLFILGWLMAVWSYISVFMHEFGRGIGISPYQMDSLFRQVPASYRKEFDGMLFKMVIVVILSNLAIILAIWLVRRYTLKDYHTFKQVFMEFTGYLAPIVLSAAVSIVFLQFHSVVLPMILGVFVSLIESLIPALMIQKGYNKNSKIAAYYAILITYILIVLLSVVVFLIMLR